MDTIVNLLNQPIQSIQSIQSPTNNLLNDTDSYEQYDFEYDISDINENFVEYIDINSYNMNLIPQNVSISTMSLTCSLGTPFNVANIYKYMILEKDNVIAIKTDKGMRKLNNSSYEFNSTNKNSHKNFFNQNTIIVNSREDKHLNVKLFKNGSIQMTGCKDLVDANIVINKLVKKLKEILFVKKQSDDNLSNDNLSNDNLLTEVKFVENLDDLNVTNFKINLINTNFGVNYYINKEELFTLLTNKGVFCRITTNHACVNIKHKIINVDNSESLVSIFVFQTGNIIITGAKKANEVKSAYNFIVSFLNQNKNKIIKKNIANVLTIEDLREVLEDS